MEPLRPDVGELADRFGPRRVARAADMQQRPPALRRHASLRRFSTPQPRSRPGTQRRRLVRSAPVQMDVEGRTNATSVEYWDNLAETWNSEVHDSLLEDERHVIRAALDEFVAGADVVLDLGCGAGNYLHALASRAASVVGVDISPRCVEQARQLCARRRLQNCRLHVADLGRCAGAEASWHPHGLPFPVAVCMNVVISPDATTRREILACAHRALAADGILLLLVPAVESALLVRKRLERLRHPKPLTLEKSCPEDEVAGIFRRSGVRTKHFREAELASTLADSGFEVLRLHQVVYHWATEVQGAGWLGDPQPFDWLVVARRRVDAPPG
eukprot:TRINITY_DN14997_c0_g1_i1.p1 TRINITY_DN14997_c0_g1~~TRINITY_DN14997_c0_g1_i1.p1  ORF type:complete len:360 (-),score=57.07 TRINITY_DN14997_c0_g1_i1:60-1049(-)